MFACQSHSPTFLSAHGVSKLLQDSFPLMAYHSDIGAMRSFPPHRPACQTPTIPAPCAHSASKLLIDQTIVKTSNVHIGLMHPFPPRSHACQTTPETLNHCTHSLPNGLDANLKPHPSLPPSAHSPSKQLVDQHLVRTSWQPQQLVDPAMATGNPTEVNLSC